MRTGATAGLLLILLTAPARAQHRAHRFPAPQPAPTPVTRARTFPAPALAPVSEAKLIAGSIILAGVGLFAGGYAGALITDDSSNSDDLDFLPGLIWGATLGESLLLPVGGHYGGGGSGKLGKEMLISAGIGLGGVALAIAAQDHSPVPGIILAAIPIAQIATVLSLERKGR